MSDLFVVTSANPLMLEEIHRSKNRGKGLVIVTTNYAVYQSVQYKHESYLVTSLFEGSDNAEFAKFFMPGLLGGEYIPGTKLSSWKVLSIDRLRFWHNKGYTKMLRFIESLTWDKAYVSLDLGASLPISVMFLADEKKKKSVAVKTEPLATREMLDIAPMLSFNEYIVETREDVEFLRKAGASGIITIRNPEKKGGPVESPQRAGLRSGLGVSKGKVLGIFFDKRDEWQFRSLIANEGIKEFQGIVIVAVDKRSKELFEKMFPDILSFLFDPYMLQACDEIISFRYDEHYCFNLPAPLRIVDYKEFNRAKQTAPGWAKVIKA